MSAGQNTMNEWLSCRNELSVVYSILSVYCLYSA